MKQLHKSYLIAYLCVLLGITNAKAGFFDAVQQGQKEHSCAIAQKIFYTQLRKGDSLQMKMAFAELLHIAETKEDLKLQASAYIMMGEYLYVHGSKNETYIMGCYENALKIIAKEHAPDVNADIYHNLGMLFYRQKKYAVAFEYLLKARYLVQQAGYPQYPNASHILYDIGYCYYDFTNFAKAKSFLQEAALYPPAFPKNEVELYNTLGLAFREMNVNDSALHCFQKALSLAQNIRDTVWQGVVTGNIGFILLRQNKYDEAIPMFYADYEISVAHREWASAVTTMLSLIDIYLMRNNIDAAVAKMKVVDTLIKHVTYPSALHPYYNRKSRLNAALGNFHEAYIFLDSARHYREMVVKKNSSTGISQAEQKAEVEKHIAEMEKLQDEKSKQLWARNIIIIIAILLLIIAYQFIHKQKITQKKDAEILRSAREQLQYYVENIREKNQLIEQFRSEIEVLHALPDASVITAEQDEIIEKLQQSTILTEGDWDQFRHLFERVHKNFFNRLKASFPGLTQAEMRLIALSKLDLSKNEMAEMLGVSLDAIRKTRQRIRKKLDIADERGLDELVAKL
jgi:tetratricopeptide (TPR) repeat protein